MWVKNALWLCLSVCVSVCLSAIITQERHIRFWWSLVRWIENKKRKLYLVSFSKIDIDISIIDFFEKRQNIEACGISLWIIFWVLKPNPGFDLSLVNPEKREKCSKIQNFRNWVHMFYDQVRGADNDRGILFWSSGLDVTLTWKN